jgi:uncharacterized membrane protein
MQLAGFHCGPPSQLSAKVRLGVTLAGLSCIGLGLIFWVAANWSLLSRFQQFMLLQTLVLAPCAAVTVSARGQVMLGLLALAATGGLLAYFGQAYQTGADLWQLFAVWAVLVFPLAICARSDIVWSAWAIVAMTGIALWSGVNAEGGWRTNSARSGVHIIAAGCSAGLTLFLSKVGRYFTGAGDWAFGIALVLTELLTITTAVTNVTESSPLAYWFCWLLTLTAATLVARGNPFNVFAASVVGLGLNVLLFAGLAVILFPSGSNNWFAPLIVLGIASTLSLGATVKTIVMLGQVAPRGGRA